MLKKLVLTILPIVFAVLLALALDAWYENVKQQRLIESTLVDIMLDIQHYAALQVVFDYNQKNLDSLQASIERFEAGEITEFVFGFGRPEINSLAWEMAKENGVAADLGRELYLELATVYLQFDRLENLWNYNYQFKLSYDPDMSQYSLARHYRKQYESIQKRQAELQEKSKEFLEKYKDASFMR
ncbi:MAG: hypothetical protein ABJP45_06405 [Cyclobacteriaceae bacterium]